MKYCENVGSIQRAPSYIGSRRDIKNFEEVGNGYAAG